MVLIVTGSANLDTFTKVGDSLAGRYFLFRLHPIDLKEGVVCGKEPAATVFERLYQYSGFPEPFLEGSLRFYKRWSKTHLDIILKQDFLDIYEIGSIKSIEILIDLLKPRVGSTVAYKNLATDLQVDDKTVKNWLQLLENFYLFFKSTPYHKNIMRSILKEPKFYFFDIARVSDPGARLENLVACALLKEIHSMEDCEGFTGRLHYLRTKNGQEIDFLIVLDEKPVLCIEVKTSDSSPSPSKNFSYFGQYLGPVICVQLILNIDLEFDTPDGIQVRDLISFLVTFDLKKYIY